MELQYTEKERQETERHATHRWADVSTFSDARRRVICFNCGLVFEAGEIDLTYCEPIESAALRAQRRGSI